ncbi:MAG: L,D-transpeptidase family protein [Chitinophagaceae bacterium]|nr:L,D-transpeptidase family protein [Chitinophagaceae bacterium]
MKKMYFSLLFLVSFLLLEETDRRFIANGNKILQKTSASDEKLLYPELVNRFYELNGNNLFWFAPENEKKLHRQQLLHSIDTADYFGLISKLYHYAGLKSALETDMMDTVLVRNADRLYTDAAIAVFKDIYAGYNRAPWVWYDQLSAKYAEADNEYLLQCLLRSGTADQLKMSVDLLEPAHQEYKSLKQELRKQKEKKSSDTVARLITSINYYRWIHHFNFEKVIVVNLAAARLHYYEKDSLVLDMKTVVGKSSTPTPRFATVCDQAILYPYWYVPRSITFKEYLPKIKNNPSWLDANNMQVIDGSGKIMDHHRLNWASFHAGYFPFIIRQSTGCDNALGIIKFNIITPYGVYLHDTNKKTVFLSASRYFSHGCIRIEKPIRLGNLLLAGKLDTTFLQSCFKEQKPIPVLLEKPVPVFAVYMPAVADTSGKIRYYRDVYKLIR